MGLRSQWNNKGINVNSKHIVRQFLLQYHFVLDLHDMNLKHADQNRVLEPVKPKKNFLRCKDNYDTSGSGARKKGQAG